ncbi:hypothetical protein [Pseudomonas urethralis]|uniref:hypothetical protein n=1 Tax=Pseudomonas urethralis TaxID=2740517 RepID=UPI001596BC64|nr:hypothetical protein [Pseudomonas urethralis]
MSLAQWNTLEGIRADLGAWAIVAALGAAGGWFYAHHSIARDCQRFGVFYSADKAYRCAIGAQAPAPQPQAGASPVDSAWSPSSGRRQGWIM